MGSFKTFLFYVFIFQIAASIEAASLFESLSPKDQKTWLKLLHFKSGKTLIDQPEFFISPLGGENPSAELDAFIKESKNQKKKYGRLNLTIHCAYPARTQFLVNVGLLKKELPTCPDFGLWEKEVSPVGLSVVFSTAYPNNPASMFGHTFLRFHKEKNSSDLLDYGANYSANTAGNDNGLIYALKGIFGGYKGYFDLSPYYMKLNEYLYGENRDLIEYQLALSQNQIDFLLAHLWELYQGAAFDYYFTEENCSFHLASLLNVVLDKPLSKIERWYYLPSDLIVQIQQANLVKNILDRPSRLRTVKKNLESLTNEEKSRVIKSAALNSDQTTALKERKALVGILNYLKFKQKEEFSIPKKELLREVLLKIANTETKKSQGHKFKSFKNRPHLAHPPQRVTVGVGYQKNQPVYQMGARSGYHDLLGRDLGLEGFSQFRFLGFDGQYFSEDQKMRIKNLLLMDIASFFPLRPFEKQISWKVGGRLEDMPEFGNCGQCWRIITEGKVGLSLGDRSWLISLLFGGVLEGSPRYSRGHRENLAYELILGKNFILSENKELKFLTSFEGLHEIGNIKKEIRSQMNLGVNYSWNQFWEVRFQGHLPLIGSTYKLQGERFEAQLGYYF